MIINVSYTNVKYFEWKTSESQPDLAKKSKNEVNIYDGRATSARIDREIPKGATVESVTRIEKRFDVDGEKALAWLIENGTEKE